MSSQNGFKLGAITIGQSPRDDIVPEIQRILGSDFEIIQDGALDGYNYDEIKSDFSPAEGEEVLVTRMRDGRHVTLAEKYITPLLQESINRLGKEEVQLIILLCTGKFPDFRTDLLVIEPQRVLHKLVSGLLENKSLGLVIPEPAQVEQAKKWWAESDLDINIKTASPYKDLKEIKKVAKEFKPEPEEIIFLDCMGYNIQMKNIVANVSQKKVILPRTMLARIIKEIF